jgi:hypothetical protein
MRLRRKNYFAPMYRSRRRPCRLRLLISAKENLFPFRFNTPPLRGGFFYLMKLYKKLETEAENGFAVHRLGALVLKSVIYNVGPEHSLYFVLTEKDAIHFLNLSYFRHPLHYFALPFQRFFPLFLQSRNLRY